jgi:hypothetical protein
MHFQEIDNNNIMAERNDEVVYLNNCELIIDSLTCSKAGTFYLVWKKGKKSTQSNRYQVTSDESVFAKETLSLSLKVYHAGNSALPRHVNHSYPRPISFCSILMDNS